MANHVRVREAYDTTTDTPAARSDAVTRSLQAAGLIGHGKKGGRGGAFHFGASHLVLHLLGVMVGDPATQAGELAPQFASLLPAPEWALDKTEPGPGDLDLPAGSIGEMLEAYVVRIAEDPLLAGLLRSKSFIVTLMLGRPGAFVNYKNQPEPTEKRGTSARHTYIMQEKDGTTLPLSDYWPLPASIRRTATIGVEALEMLAELLRDTWEHQGRLPLAGSGSGSSTNTPPGDDPGPKNEKSAALPGATPSRSRNHQRGNAAAPKPHNREATDRRGASQAFRDGGDDHAEGIRPGGDQTTSAKRSARYEYGHAHPASSAFG